jgi:hypothetical protein
VSIWIGEIQWMLNHGFALAKNPILRNLDNIHLRDAIFNPDGSEPEWPEADVIVGNPPFVGNKKMLGALGAEYVARLRSLYQGRVPGGADLVTYWFEKARAQIETGRVRYAGLVATNSIRGGPSRKVLERIVETGSIYDAWSDEPWINEGAGVRVSLIGFGPRNHGRPVRLNGSIVASIYADLIAAAAGSDMVDVTTAARLKENMGVSFMGITKSGQFDVPGELARTWIAQPNPHGRSNADVLFPSCNGRDLVTRHAGQWVVDFGVSRPEVEAALYAAPFEYAAEHVRPFRETQRREAYRLRWWIHAEARPGLRAGIGASSRYIATSKIARHRIFVWLSRVYLPLNTVIVITRCDDTTFGIVHSRMHEVWTLAKSAYCGVGNDPTYTPTTTFETFPFPEGLTPADTAGPVETLEDGVVLPPVAPERRPVALAIAQAAHRLNALRENWLNPAEWVERVPEVVPGYPDRIIPKPGREKDLKARTLTNLYNQRHHWLVMAHKALDMAVAGAYGWEDYTPEMPDEEILGRLLALNLERSQA